MKYQNGSMPLFVEYFLRQRMAKLGYTSNINTLSAWKAESFGVIDLEIAGLKAEAAKKASKKRGSR